MRHIFLSLCVLAFLTHTVDAAESTKDRLKSQLEQARYEAIGLEPPKDTAPPAPPVEAKKPEPIQQTNPTTPTREVLAEIKSEPIVPTPPSDELLLDAPKAEKTTAPTNTSKAPIVAAKPVTTKTPVEKPVKAVKPTPVAKKEPAVVKPVITQSKTPEIKRTVERIESAPVVRIAAPIAAPPPPQIAPRNKYLPPSAARTSPWTVRTVEARDKSKAFCLIESTYDNATKLMIGQDKEGFSTVGINYGLDMLKLNQKYYATLRLDDAFEEDFSAYADSVSTLVVQLGRKQSFFDSFANAQNLYITLPGVASAFTLSQIDQAYDALNECLISIGAKPVVATKVAPPMMQVDNPPVIAAPLTQPPEAPPAPAILEETKTVEPTPVKAVETPAVTPPVATPALEPVVIPSTDEKPIILTPPKPKAVAKEAPKSKPVAEAAAPAPKTYSLDHLIFDEKPVAPSAPPVVAPTPMPMPVAAPAVETSTESPKAMPVPVVTPPVVTAPSDEPMPLTKTAPPQPKQIMWTDRARDMAQKFGLTITTTQAESLSWQKDTLNGNAYHYTGDDVIDTANIALDEAQEKCKGTFDSQLGIPETYGTVTVQPIESKCVTGTDTHVSTWLLIQQDKDIVAWHIQTPRTQTTQAFALRDAMVAKLKGTMQ